MTRTIESLEILSWGPVTHPPETATLAEQIDTLSREDAEFMAAKVLRALAAESFRRHRNITTATREAAQLTHLATRLESFAGERSSAL